MRCTRLNAPYGLRVPGVDIAAQKAVAVGPGHSRPRRRAGPGRRCSSRQIDSVDIPGLPVDSSDKALAVIEKAGAPNIGFFADLYHLAKMGEDVADVLSRYQESLLHVQVADPPGRGAPGTGTV